MKNTTLEERFEEKIRIDQSTKCYLWTASKNDAGYGRFRIMRNRWVLAHRWAYEHYVGPIAKGLKVCHTCDNPSCVNPDHLWLGTQGANMHDMRMKGRRKGITATKGSHHGMSKLTEEQVVSIYISSSPDRAIAEEYGVSYQRVRAIKRKVVWKHILDTIQ
jgi:hypothetical protein